jgi:TonB-dependent SusC/RagA subfamily outer membrane receptor
MFVLQQPNLFSLAVAFLSLALFYLLYEGWYGKETFWQVNRLYLLLAPALAFAIPHLRVTVAPEAVPPGALDPNLLALLQQWQAGGALEAKQAGLRIGEAVLGLYATGVALALLRLFMSSYRILRLIRKGRRSDFGDCTLVVHEGFREPASFFRFVFSSSVQSLPEMVLQHELVHVRQRHTLDVLLMECWVALHWYNPLIYRFRNRLRATHEFIADAAVVGQQHQGAYAYAQLLISQPLNQSDMLYNTFAAQITSRLRMLARRPSASWRLIAHAASVPVILGLFLLFSIQVAQSAPLTVVAQHIETLEAQPVAVPSLLAVQEEDGTAMLADTLPKKQEEKVIVVVGRPLAKDSSRILEGHPMKADTLVFESSQAPKNTMADALIVIDGVVQTVSSQQALQSVKPEDIESINVLKGPSATNLYGEQGKNGVIQIITKKGGGAASPGKPGQAETRTLTINSAASPGENVEMNVKIVQGQELPAAEGNMRTNVRVIALGELIGEVQNVRRNAKTQSEAVFLDEIREVRVEGGDKKGGKTTEVRTITLEFSDRKQAEEALKALKKNAKK